MFEKVLANFREPKEANEVVRYVLFGCILKDYKSNEEYEDLHCLRMVGSHATTDKITYYAKKPGFKLLKYYLPGDDRPWPELRQHCDFLLGAVDAKVSELSDENANLKKKVDELARKLSKAA